jgi:hypothetical protein
MTRTPIAGSLAVAVGATLLSAGLVLLSPRDARAWLDPTLKSKAQNLKNAASRLRDLAGEKATLAQKGAASGGTKEWDWYSQTTWLQNAASRSDTLAQRMDEGASKELTPDFMRKLEQDFSNLRKALLSESSSHARQAAGDVKARQDKAAAAIQALK